MNPRRAMGAPRRYVQGPDVLRDISALTTSIGKTPFLVADPVALDRERSAFGSAFPDLAEGRFSGETTAGEIDRLARSAAKADPDFIIGFGGGKTIDTAKGVALALGRPIVVAPTVASNDAPTSRLIVIYDNRHALTEVRMLPNNPDLVIADTAIIARAPRRFLACGIGDALSKVYEASSCREAGGLNFYQASPPLAAMALARCCHDTIRADGLAALSAVDRGVPDAALENVVEAAILMSGLGFESGGLSLAHALVRGFSAHPVTTRLMHGELVAFGTLVQAAHEGGGDEELRGLARFCLQCGLPVTFGSLGLVEVGRADFETIIAPTLAASYIGHLRNKADASTLRASLTAADAVGRSVS